MKNKNAHNEMKCKVIVIKKPHTQITHNKDWHIKEKINVEIIKTIMSKKNTTLPSVRNQDWKTIKTEFEKINELSTHISTNNISKLNEIIYVEVKLDGDNRCYPKEYGQN